jgi:serine/threonine-protein kinase
MSDVFISYKAEDRRRIALLVQALEQGGLSVWWDAHIGGGEGWRESIQQHLDEAKCVIVVWSKHSTGPHGDFVRDEATRALRRQSYLPILIDKVDLPLGFGESQALSLHGWHGDRSDRRYLALLTAVRAIVSGRPRPRSVPISTSVNRRTVVIGGVAAGVTAAAGGWFMLKPGAAAASNSIAVLPFANLSSDARQTYFSDGIAEELRNALARVVGLKVVGRISSEAVRNLDAKTAARRLRVANVLAGTVRESPSTIRISAELIDGRTGLDRWSEDYDRPPGDAITIQTDIAQSVATALVATLGIAARAAFTVGGTANAAAQRLVLEARAIAREKTKTAREHAMQLIDGAIRLDPNYADAYAEKSLMLSSYSNNFAKGAAELASARTEAMRLGQTAIREAPKLALGHAAVAQVFESNLDMAPAANEFERAIELAPGNADIVGRYVFLLACIGKPAEALKTADRGITLDPLNHVSYENRVSALYYLRRYQEALDYAERIRGRSPDLFTATGLIADCLLMLGRTQDAIRTYGLLIPDSWQMLNGQTLALARAGDRAGAMKLLAKYKRLYGDSSHYQYAGIYAQLGDRKRALDALEQALAFRDGGLASIKFDPRLDPIRGQSRFNAVVKTMNFPA